jgi:hypothetical protein
MVNDRQLCRKDTREGGKTGKDTSAGLIIGGDLKIIPGSSMRCWPVIAAEEGSNKRKSLPVKSGGAKSETNNWKTSCSVIGSNKERIPENAWYETKMYRRWLTIAVSQEKC